MCKLPVDQGVVFKVSNDTDQISAKNKEAYPHSERRVTNGKSKRLAI